MTDNPDPRDPGPPRALPGRLRRGEHESQQKDYLFERIAYRMQEQRYGGLSRAASSVTIVESTARDPRLPSVGTVPRRDVRGEVQEVRVLTERFASISMLATKIAGARWNGFTFFRSGQEEGRMIPANGKAPKIVGCAIYTRKSTSEGLDSDFK